jgi:hypothetical protein
MKSIYRLRLWSILFILSSICACEPEKTKQEVCNCCTVTKKTYPIDTSRVSLLSQYKWSSDYDIIEEARVKFVNTRLPFPNAMQIWANNYEINMFPDEQKDCPIAAFGVKDIYYTNFGRLTYGYKTAQRTFHNRNENTISPSYDTTAFFLSYYVGDGFSDVSNGYHMDYKESDSLIRNKRYGDFTYRGRLMFLVNSSIGTYYPIYNHIFTAQTNETDTNLPKVIYIDRDYGLVRYELNNGEVITIIH